MSCFNAAKQIVTIVALALFGVQAHAQKQRLEFWTQGLSPKFDPFIKGIVAKYNQANPNVEVVWSDYPWDIIQAKFSASLASGKPPVLANLDVPTTYDYLQKGLIQPIDQWVDRGQFLNGAIADVTFNGKIYSFPFYNGANIIAFNTDLFKKAGLDPKNPPNSLDTQIAYAKILRAKAGVAGFGPALGPTKVEGLMLQEGLEVIKDRKAVFNSPAHVELVRKLADAYKSGALFKDNLFTKDNFQVSMAAYNSGRMAMMVSAPTALTRVRDNAPEIYKVTDVAPAPIGKTGIPAGGWLFGFVIPKNVPANLLGEAGKLGAYLTNAENQLAFSKLTGALPTSRKAASDPYFHTIDPKSGPVEKGVIVAAKNLEALRTVYLTEKNSEILAARLSSAVEQAVTGRKDAKVALDEAVEFWNKKLGSAK